jgi:ABC-type multidrug transport system fused ATPase/permease subunit
MIRTFLSFRRFVSPYRWSLVVGVLLAVVETGFGLAQPWPLKIIVDDVLMPGASGSGTTSIAGIPMSSEMILAAGVLAILVIAGLAALTGYGATVLMEGAGQRIGNDIREAAFAHLQRLSLRYHGEHPVGDLTARVTGDVDRLQDMQVQVLATLLPNVLLVAGVVVVMVAVDPGFALLALSATPVMALLIYRSTISMKLASRRARGFGGDVAAAANEGFAAIQVVQAFSLEDRSRAQFRDLNGANLDASLAAIRLEARLAPIVDLAAAISAGIVLWSGGVRVLSGEISVGLLLVFLTYVGSLYRPIKSLSKLSYVISRGNAAAERVGAVLGETPDVADRPGARPLPRIRGRVRIEQVTFSYGREVVLDDVSLAIEPGEVVALVGRTGAGKSTLASLVARFHDPDGGSVLVDDVDVRDVTLRSLRAQVALVLQDTVLFRGTLWDNIACGRPDATPEDVEAAVRLALVDEFTDRFPEGLQTPIGERGLTLSGGQRQRVAIARAIVRDAPILILDEPTSALDPASEVLVVEALHNLMATRTTLVIAHRLSTIRRADRIIVLDGGRIIETGSPATLIAAGGAYAHMLDLQGQITTRPTSTPRTPAKGAAIAADSTGGQPPADVVPAPNRDLRLALGHDAVN